MGFETCRMKTLRPAAVDFKISAPNGPASLGNIAAIRGWLEYPDRPPTPSGTITATWVHAGNDAPDVPRPDYRKTERLMAEILRPAPPKSRGQEIAAEWNHKLTREDQETLAESINETVSEVRRLSIGAAMQALGTTSGDATGILAQRIESAIRAIRLSQS